MPHPVPVAHAPAPAAAPAPVPTSRYGISSDFLAAAGTPAGQLFHSRVLGGHGRVRLFLPYDARGTWNGSACVPSPAYAGGAAAWSGLTAALTQARQEGLVPQIVFAAGTGAGGVPSHPDPADPAQAADYACGVRLALQALWQTRRTTGMPVDVEAVNEPESNGYAPDPGHPCPAPDRAPSCSGPWQAAMLWYEAQTEADQLHRTEAGFPEVTVAALTMSAPQDETYLDAGRTALSSAAGTPYDGYYQDLYRIVHCAPGYGGCGDPADNPPAMPANWAVHDYADPTAQGTGDLTAFVHALAGLQDRYAQGAGANVWVTEAGVQLDARARSDLNHPGGVRCPAADGAPADTLGCLVDGRPAAQVRGAQSWRALGQVAAPTAHGTVGVSQLFWYQFALPSKPCTPVAPCVLASGAVQTSGSLPMLHAWDSAVVDASGAPRQSFCALVSEPATDCAGRPTAYADAQWVDWWEPKPAGCPAHDGAWVADSPHSGVPGGEQCYYSAAAPIGPFRPRRTSGRTPPGSA